MAKNEALSYLVGTVTQGSADAYAESQIVTGLGSVGNRAFQIREILWRIPQVANINGAGIVLTLSRKTFSTQPQVTERTLIHRFERYVTFSTSGATVQGQVERLAFSEQDNFLIVEDPIYFQIDSDLTTVANVGRVRIGYVPVAISELDRLTLINNTLAS